MKTYRFVQRNIPGTVTEGVRSTHNIYLDPCFKDKLVPSNRPKKLAPLPPREVPADRDARRYGHGRTPHGDLQNEFGQQGKRPLSEFLRCHGFLYNVGVASGAKGCQGIRETLERVLRYQPNVFCCGLKRVHMTGRLSFTPPCWQCIICIEDGRGEKS